MKDTIKIPAGHELKKVGENSYEIVPIETKSKFWMPDKNESYMIVGVFGGSSPFRSIDNSNCLSECNSHHNVFRTRSDAEDVSRYQRVFNAVCRAVKQVSPDYVPVWDDITKNWVPIWNCDRWLPTCYSFVQTIFPPVESRAKCEEVIALLNAEGIVPVGVEE